MIRRVRDWLAGRVARAQVRLQADPDRRAELRATPIADAWAVLIARELRVFHRLSPAQQARLLADANVFAHEKELVAHGDFAHGERARVLVAATAALMVLGRDLAHLDHVLAIEVWPHPPAEAEAEVAAAAGHYQHGTVGGQPLGRVSLVWAQVESGLAHDDGDNVIVHELAHALDHGDGHVDALVAHPRYPVWQDRLRHLPLRRWTDGDREVTRVVADVDGPELFAVASELFFERPGRLDRLDPELFDALRAYYQLDPRAFA